MWRYATTSLIVLTISLFYHYYSNKPRSLVEYPKPLYDYIIVGGGTAGCVLAARLSESPNVTVLLVEAGGDFGWLSSIPILAPLLHGTDTDWAYQTEEQIFSSRGFWNHKQKCPRGKGLGGSGQMNYLVHSFGRPEDYKEWPKGWSHADFLPYFKKVSEIMNVITAPEEEYLTNAFVLAEEAFRFENATLRKAFFTAKKGLRQSAYHAYLQDAWNRQNLHILTNTLVSKIFFKGSKAEGIKVTYRDNSFGRINVRKEVILCAGAINTPQLLMLSGIGPANELNKFRIPIVQNLSSVGTNLFDHMSVPLFVSLEAKVSITLAKLQSLYEILNYLLFGKGWYATNAVMGTGFIDNSGLLLFGMATAEERVFRDIGNYQHRIFRSLFPTYNNTHREGFIYLASCLQPKSRGYVLLRSINIHDNPKINPAYLENEEDVSCTRNAIMFGLRTLNTELFRQYGAKIHVPNFEECQYFNQDYQDLGFNECIIRTAGMTSYHPGGTCKMGTADDAVVDKDLRVRGTTGLRIMDASVLPSPISGAPNSVIIAMAERAAELIIADFHTEY